MTYQLKATQSVEIKEMLTLTDRRFKMTKGTFLYQEGMTANEVYIIISGKIQISKISADGRELSLRICSTNDICGELSIFTHSPKYMLNALVIDDAEIAAVKKDTLEKEMLRNGSLAFEFMKWMSDHSRKTQTKFRDLVLNGKKGALYSTLIRMTNSYGVHLSDGILIDLPLTNQELANFCGTSRESTNRILNELKRENIISVAKGKIVIHDLQFLKDEIGCEDCPIIYCNIE
ncbi:Crp/Fnr family transcriptional regulator [Robertmurraya sp. DFI.2.37]|uniref:Crp/Fnr family transcriptional regulator n=1 Tax=Robertmurraya sp. DFI.2.37 TaxID=3031819 RepID=UPI0012449D27|nr:Crp/Fnr family transcriptional regulator [Robertmurraya sp. DFI.2.37]MDF1507409.1 Crp/Fnr family transcriptional regulator [Robertmurraya sp. DFI.2.37]